MFKSAVSKRVYFKRARRKRAASVRLNFEILSPANAMSFKRPDLEFQPARASAI